MFCCQNAVWLESRRASISQPPREASQNADATRLQTLFFLRLVRSPAYCRRRRRSPAGWWGAAGDGRERKHFILHTSPLPRVLRRKRGGGGSDGGGGSGGGGGVFFLLFFAASFFFLDAAAACAMINAVQAAAVAATLMSKRMRGGEWLEQQRVREFSRVALFAFALASRRLALRPPARPCAPQQRRRPSPTAYRRAIRLPPSFGRDAHIFRLPRACRANNGGCCSRRLPTTIA